MGEKVIGTGSLQTIEPVRIFGAGCSKNLEFAMSFQRMLVPDLCPDTNSNLLAPALYCQITLRLAPSLWSCIAFSI